MAKTEFLFLQYPGDLNFRVRLKLIRKTKNTLALNQLWGKNYPVTNIYTILQNTKVCLA